MASGSPACSPFLVHAAAILLWGSTSSLGPLIYVFGHVADEDTREKGTPENHLEQRDQVQFLRTRHWQRECCCAPVERLFAATLFPCRT